MPRSAEMLFLDDGPIRTGENQMSDNNFGEREGCMRLADILAPRGPLPISKSSWWSGVRSGRYPQPIKLGPRITAWSRRAIMALVEGGVQ